MPGHPSKQKTKRTPARPAAGRLRPELLLLALALAVRVAMVLVMRDSIYFAYHTQNKQSDMYANYQWAAQIRAGDWLGRDTYHPYFGWMEEVAPLPDWHRWRGGPRIFQQSPFYPYLLAALGALFRDSVTAVLLFQAAVGAAYCGLVFVLARRLFDRRTALAALAGSALFGPMVVAESVLLRDFLLPVFVVLAFLGLLRASEGAPARAVLLSGAALGAGILVRETLAVFAPVALLWLLLVVRRRRAGAAALRTAALFAAGVAAALLPLVARNVAVGAAPLAVSNRAPEGFVEGLAPNPYDPYEDIAARIRAEMQHGPFSVPAFLRRAFQARGAELPAFYARKLVVIADPFELGDNLDHVYLEHHSALARLLPGWRLFLPLGLLGLAASLARRRAEDLLLAGYVLAQVGALAFGPVYSRYRLPLAPVLVLYGAYFAVWSWDRAAGARDAAARWRVLAAPAGLAAAALIAFGWLLPFLPRRYHCRPSTFQIAANFYAGQNRLTEAREEIERLVRCVEETGAPIDLTEHRDKIRKLKDAGH